VSTIQEEPNFAVKRGQTMGISVSLKQVAEELDALPNEWTAYINRETGEIYSFSDEEATRAEDQEEEDEDERADWEKESLARAREVLAIEAWIALPGKFEINEWEIMRDFAQSQTDREAADNLLRAIQGRGAFRYFKDMVDRYGLRDEWFEFKERALKEIAREALEEAGIPYTQEPN
jgi:hypothetical protein